MDNYAISACIEDYSKNVNLIVSLSDMEPKSDRIFERIIRLESSVEMVVRGIEMADLSDLEEAVLDCRLDGMNVTEISQHVGLHRKTIRKKLDDISLRISQALIEGIKN